MRKNHVARCAKTMDCLMSEKSEPLSRPDDEAARPLFALSDRQVQWIMLVGFVSVGYALYVRYLGIESPLALSCDNGLRSGLCSARAVLSAIFRQSGFGIIALIAALLHLIHPSIVLLTIGTLAAGLGIVLYNVALSGLAIGIMLLAFARAVPAKE